MTPNARYAAAIEILDRVFVGEAAEKTLTNWARSNRYAGSKDRAAIRDIVFDCLRCKRSFMYAGFEGVRGCVVGHILAANGDVAAVFTGEKFAPPQLSEQETSALNRDRVSADMPVRLDIPDWIAPKLEVALEDETELCMIALQKRGALDLRVNIHQTTMDDAYSVLEKEDIETTYVDVSPTALRVLTNPRRVALSKAYQTGLVEIQDAGSQAVVNALPLSDVQTVLDYCAGGGGKSLAIAGRVSDDVKLYAYDQSQARMNDLPVRARRAGAKITVLVKDPVNLTKQYDLVLLDVPCSGTGAWRRNPDGKWRFSKEDLTALCETQKAILNTAKDLVTPDGYLAYVTCSLLLEENENQIVTFLNDHPEWSSVEQKKFLPNDGTDGFYLEVLHRK